MRFTWKKLELFDALSEAWQGTCADATQRIRLTKGVDGLWRGRLDCGVTQASHSVPPTPDFAVAKRRAAAMARAAREGRLTVQAER